MPEPNLVAKVLSVQYTLAEIDDMAHFLIACLPFAYLYLQQSL